MTLREHLEAIRDDHTQREPGWNECLCGDFWDTCRSRAHAVAALAILDAAERGRYIDCPGMRSRIIEDPESANPGTNAHAASRQGVSTDVAPDPAQTGAYQDVEPLRVAVPPTPCAKQSRRPSANSSVTNSRSTSPHNQRRESYESRPIP